MGRTLIKELPIEERPRERLSKYGVKCISNEEILAIILKTGTKGVSVKDLANNILKTLDNFSDLKSITKQELTKINGIGETKAVELLASIELGKRLYLEPRITSKEKYKNAKEIFLKNKHLFHNQKQEYFYCLYLNTKKELIERKLLFMGTINKSIVHPREIFKEAYRLSASSIVCMHNHPCGDKTPSKDDIILTNSLVEIGRLQQMPITDHIIFTNDDYYSFYEQGHLTYEKSI